jgi:pyridoxine 5-phosphate synthase
MTKLSVNVNKVAVLRNSRGGAAPSPLRAATVAISAGAHGITVHPRPDLRHITPDDVLRIAQLLAAHPGIEYNIEGNPFAPASLQYPGLLALLEQARPTQVTLVPDADSQITSDHGWDLVSHQERLQAMISSLKPWVSRVSLFVDSDCKALAIAKQVGADAVEIYTGPFADAVSTQNRQAIDQQLAQCRSLVAQCRELGLLVNAGHDLNQQNLPILLSQAPSIAEVSIGHALFEDAIYDGLTRTVQNYLKAVTLF